MRQALLTVDGVVAADVSYDEATAVVRYFPEVASTERMIEAVVAAGFRARRAEEGADEP